MTVTTSLSNEMKTYYHRQLLTRALPNLVYSQTAVKTPLPIGLGKTVEFRRFEKLTAVTTSLASEVTPPAETNLTVNVVNATVAEYGEFIKFSKLVQTTAYDDVLGQSGVLLGENMGESLDTIIRNVILPLASASSLNQMNPGNKARTALGAGDVMAYETLLRIRSTLATNRVKPLLGGGVGRYLGIIHPNVTRQLFQDPDIKDIMKFALNRGEGQPFFTGVLSIPMLGIDFVETDLAPSYSIAAFAGGDPAVAVYATIVLGRECVGAVELDGISTDFIFKNIGSAGAADPLNQYGTVAWYAAFVSLILNANFGVVCYSAQ